MTLGTRRSTAAPFRPLWPNRRFLGEPARLTSVIERGATLAALLLASAVLLAAPWLAYRWLGLPFIGAFVEQTLVFNSMGPSGAADWAAYRAGLRHPDHLLSVAGTPVTTTVDLERALAAHRPGDEVILTVAGEDGRARQVAVMLQRFTSEELVAYFVLPYLIGLAYLIIGVWVVRRRWGDPVGSAFGLACAGIAVTVGGLFDLYTTHVFAWAWTAAIPLGAAGLMSLAMVFPHEPALAVRYPRLRWLPYLPAGMLVAIAEWRLYDFAAPSAYAAEWMNEYSFAGAGLLVFLGGIAYRRARAASPLVREQARIILWGGGAAFAPLVIYLILVTARVPIIFNVLLFFTPLVLFPLTIAFVILRYRLPYTDALLGRALVTTAMTLLAGVSYLLLGLVAALMGQPFPTADPFLAGVFLFLLVVLFEPVRDRLQGWMDRRLLSARVAYRAQLQAFSRELTRTAGLEQVLRLLHRTVRSSLLPDHDCTFLLEEAGRRFSGRCLDARPNSPPDFDRDGALARRLAARPEPLFLPRREPLPTDLIPEAGKLSRLDARLIVPFMDGDRLTGWLALGAKRSGAPYTRDDLDFVGALCDQTALALERAWLFEAERRRRQEAETLREATAVLTSAVELPRALDDILTQLGRVVSYDSACICLLEGDRLRVVALRGFETPEVISGQTFPTDSLLLAEIRQEGRALVLPDASADPRWLPWPGGEHNRGWMGIPLLTRGQVIGFLTVDSRHVSVYGSAEAELAQALANQAAIAIVNLMHTERLHRLYQDNIEHHESERTDLARELHDQVLNELAALVTGGGMAEAPPHVMDGFRSLSARLRLMIAGLRPPMLNYGLGAALDQLADELAERTAAELRVEVDQPEGQVRFAPAVELHAFRILQQAAENAVRHAEARQIRIHGRMTEGALDLTVEDDGKGADVPTALDVADLLAQRRFGLAGMVERAALIGAAMRVDSVAGRGTLVRVSWRASGAPRAGERRDSP